MLKNLEKILPTRQTRWIAGITIPLSINAFVLGDLLQKIGINIELLTKIEIRILLLLSVLCFGLFSLLVSLIISFRHKEKIEDENLKLKYAIYWDKDNNPYCPSCKSPAIRYETNPHGTNGYHCRKCKDVFPLTDISGNDIQPETIMRKK